MFSVVTALFGFHPITKKNKIPKIFHKPCLFLVASKQPYKRGCPSVHPSTRDAFARRPETRRRATYVPYMNLFVVPWFRCSSVDSCKLMGVELFNTSLFSDLKGKTVTNEETPTFGYSGIKCRNLAIQGHYYFIY